MMLFFIPPTEVRGKYGGLKVLLPFCLYHIKEPETLSSTLYFFSET